MIATTDLRPTLIYVNAFNESKKNVYDPNFKGPTTFGTLINFRLCFTDALLEEFGKSGTNSKHFY